jgi:NADH-quinone oxidoreductase subunit I
MKNAFSEIFGGVKSLLTGMRITIGQFFKPTVTVHYPHQTLPIPPRFRGHIELVRDEAGKSLCYVCKLCEKACPSDCITVEGIKPEGAKRKTVTQYRLDFTKCSLCGSCVEACRDGAIQYSREYNLASLNKDEFVMDLFKRLEAQRLEDEKAGRIPPMAEAPKPEPAQAEPAKPAEPAKAAATQPAPAAAPTQPANVEVK